MPCCDAGALAALRGLHAPPDPGLIRLDVAAAVGLGLVLALLAAGAASAWSRRRASLRRAARGGPPAARVLAPPARRVALARLLRRLARTLGAPEAEDEAGRAATLDRILAADGFFSRGPGRAL